MIEKRFSPTEMTYEKFMSTLRSCSNLFYEQVESTLNIINFSSDNSPKVEYEIKNRIDILKLIIEKVDELTNELVLNMGSLDSDSEVLVVIAVISKQIPVHIIILSLSFEIFLIFKLLDIIRNPFNVIQIFHILYLVIIEF